MKPTMYWGINMAYSFTHPIRDIPAYSAIPTKKEVKGCAVCSTEFIKRKNADTFELRQLCNDFIKTWKERDRIKDVYRKDV